MKQTLLQTAPILALRATINVPTKNHTFVMSLTF